MVQNPKPPYDALNSILVYLETELKYHKETDRIARLNEEVRKVREWLSTLDAKSGSKIENDTKPGNPDR
jgi:hypothetical protein